MAHTTEPEAMPPSLEEALACMTLEDLRDHMCLEEFAETRRKAVVDGGTD